VTLATDMSELKDLDRNADRVQIFIARSSEQRQLSFVMLVRMSAILVHLKSGLSLTRQILIRYFSTALDCALESLAALYLHI
jgi:hypothetical protein